MHDVGAKPLDHRTRSAGLETGGACQRTSHPPQLHTCSTGYGSFTAAPCGSHLPREGHPPKRFLVEEAPCPGPSDVAPGGAGGGSCPAPFSRPTGGRMGAAIMCRMVSRRAHAQKSRKIRFSQGPRPEPGSSEGASGGTLWTQQNGNITRAVSGGGKLACAGGGSLEPLSRTPPPPWLP